MKHFLAVAILFAASYVATTDGLGTALPDGGILLDFEIQSGDTHDTLSLENRPYLYKREGDVKLTFRNEYAYIATVEVGSNKQKNTVLLDTASSYSYFIAKEVECVLDFYEKRDYFSYQNYRGFAERDSLDDISSSFGSETSVHSVETGDATDFEVPTATETSSGDTHTNNCTNHGSFETSLSSSFKKESEYVLSIYEIEGIWIDGIWGQDSITIGSTTLDSVTFGIVTKTNRVLGVLGLSSGHDSYIDYEYLNFPFLLKQQGAINKVAYSLFLNAVNTTGSVLFGAVDHAKYSGTLVTVPILYNDTDDPYMQVMVDGISIVDGSNDISMTSNKYTAVLAGGAVYSYFPESLFDKIVDTLGAEYIEDQGYIVKCPKRNDDLTFEFDFSGLTISVPYSNLVSGYYSSSSATTDLCRLELVSSYEEYIQLGDNVLSSAYVVYDLEDLTISLAQAKYTNETDIEVISSSIPRASKASLYSSTYFETGIEESTAETTLSYATGNFSSVNDLTFETGIFEATETGSGDKTRSSTGTGSSTGSSTRSRTSSSKSGSSPSTSSTTKSSGEVQTVKYTLHSGFIASAFGLLVLVSI